jgi:uncharacterized membrane protein
MSNPLHNAHKTQFQLERLILFSDAVFAIAITLLAIELKVPEFHKELITDHDLVEALVHMIPKFIGFLISFLIIGQYWSVHHRLFGFVVDYNHRLLWLNLFFLLAIILMPFTTAFYSEYISYWLMTPTTLYVCNISVLGIMSFTLWKYVGNPRNRVSDGLDGNIARYFSLRAIMIPAIFIVSLIIYFFAPRFAIILPPLIPLFVNIITRAHRKKIRANIK